MLNDTFRKSLSRYALIDFRMRWQVWIYRRYLYFEVFLSRFSGIISDGRHDKS